MRAVGRAWRQSDTYHRSVDVMDMTPHIIDKPILSQHDLPPPLPPPISPHPLKTPRDARIAATTATTAGRAAVAVVDAPWLGIPILVCLPLRLRRRRRCRLRRRRPKSPPFIKTRLSNNEYWIIDAAIRPATTGLAVPSASCFRRVLQLSPGKGAPPPPLKALEVCVSTFSCFR